MQMRSITWNSECEETIKWSELYHLSLIQGKLYAYQVINLICILQFLIDSYVSDKKAGPAYSFFIYLLMLMFFPCLKNCFEFWDHTLSRCFLIIMKNCFIIIIIAQRVYGLKIKMKFPRKKKEHISSYTRKNFFWTSFFHQIYNYQSKTPICKWELGHILSS